MANSKSASKRARQAVRRTARNRSALSTLRSLHKRSHADGASAKDRATLISAIDKAAKSGRIHRNAANRRKSRLARAQASAAK